MPRLPGTFRPDTTGIHTAGQLRDEPMKTFALFIATAQPEIDSPVPAGARGYSRGMNRDGRVHD